MYPYFYKKNTFLKENCFSPNFLFIFSFKIDTVAIPWIRSQIEPKSWIRIQVQCIWIDPQHWLAYASSDLVAAAVAIVGGGEDGHNVPVVGPVVAFHHQLMGPGTQFHLKIQWALGTLRL